jgi:N-acyl-L-homoserine lactone synthetase
MVQTNPEAVSRVQEAPLSLHLISAADEGLFREWLDRRQEYVERRGWRVGDDRDEYDANPDTLHVLMRKDETIFAGMRLTPASTPEETLSWSMLTPAMQEEATAHLPEPNGEAIWDLTRLVSTGTDRHETVDAFIQMFAVGLGLNQEVTPHPRWFFTTTRPFFRMFKWKGIEFTPIVQGKISAADQYESVFCYIDPATCLEKIKSRPAAHRNVFEAAMKGMALLEDSRVPA